jgi:4-amino-4-deoxy-L-arabinose transferase-like glycosyltransferase
MLWALAALAVLVKIPTLGTGAFWDEAAWLGQAGWLADAGLHRALPGLRPDAQFFGHPPGLHFAAALLFTIFGKSIEVAHLMIAVLGAIGVCATYAYVRAAHDARTALLAALLLLLSPAWFSSAGVFLADLPVAALGMLSAVAAMRSRLWLYCIAASCMVLVKETAVALIAALIAFRLLTRLPLTRATLRDAAPYAVPLLVFGAFVVLQKVVTGRFFYIYDFETDDLFEFSLGAAAGQAAEITRWLFVSQFRWVLTLAIVAHLLVSPEAGRRRGLLLFALVAMASGYVFSVLYYMPRYLLPVLPFFYALGAVSVMGLARGGRRQLAAMASTIGITIWSLATDPYRGHGEDNMRYVGIVRMHQEAAAEVSAHYSSSRILSAWPVAAELADPLLGFVREPLQVKWFAGPQDLTQADVAVVSDPANDPARELVERLRESGWTAVSVRGQGEHSIAVYEPPPNAAPAPLPGRGPERE